MEQIKYCTCPEYQYKGNTKMTSTNPKTGKFDSLVGCSNQVNPFQPVCWKCLKPRKEPKWSK
jgi:hypothetical protein